MSYNILRDHVRGRLYKRFNLSITKAEYTELVGISKVAPIVNKLNNRFDIRRLSYITCTY